MYYETEAYSLHYKIRKFLQISFSQAWWNVLNILRPFLVHFSYFIKKDGLMDCTPLPVTFEETDGVSYWYEHHVTRGHVCMFLTSAISINNIVALQTCKVQLTLVPHSVGSSNFVWYAVPVKDFSVCNVEQYNCHEKSVFRSQFEGNNC